MNIGVIGYGSMGKMLLDKFRESNKYNLYVSNRNIEKLNNVDKSINVCKTNMELASKTNIIILCVRPIDLKDVLNDIKDVVKDDSIIISLNGSVAFDTLKKIINKKLTKVIPSVTAEINKSQTLICYNDKMNESDKEKVVELFNIIGNTIILDEKEMGMGSELVSCMPGFIASIFDCICKEAKKHTNIRDEEIVKMVLNTVNSTSELMLTKNMSFSEVVDRVATKGGITIEGTNVVYEKLPLIVDELFDKTLEKRKQTKANAEKQFD